MLHNICKTCSRVLLPEDERRLYLRRLRRPDLDNLQRSRILKKISLECRKCKNCPYCGALNGTVRKVPHAPLKLVHNKFDAYLKSTAKSKVEPPSKASFDRSFETARRNNTELDKHLRKAVDDMNPLRVLNLFQRMNATDCELVGVDRPDRFIWQYLPAPPVTIRPSVAQEGGTTENDITTMLSNIVSANAHLLKDLRTGAQISAIMEKWEHLQVSIAQYIAGDVPGLPQDLPKGQMGFCQRLKGKQGRFRGNLSGKRVDFSGRTVIGPDPNLSIDEVAVPERVARNMTYPEKAHQGNIEKLRRLVRNGIHKYPGAKTLAKKVKDENQPPRRIFLGLTKDGALDRVANELEIGDTVERHLEDGDIVLFNRQPSLHRMSILCHRVKVRPWRTFRLNECVCNPYNADFDGDEMNLHVPQTEEARTEALELMGVKHNLATPKNGTPLIAAIQDFITAAFLLSSKDNFFDRKTFTHICSFMFNGETVVDPDTGEHMSIDLPPPTVLKPQMLWTGKQIFNVLMRPSKKSKVLVNLEAKCRQYKGKDQDLNLDDAYLVVRNSEIMCGVMDKSTVGDGKKDSVFYVIMRDFGPDYAVQAMNRLSKLSARWLTNRGFSMGISDVYPGDELKRKKQVLINKAYAEVDDIIAKFKKGKLGRDAGCTEEQTMENRIQGKLNNVRQDAGDICFEQLSRWNSPLIMAKCGSKGSNINVAQMVSTVGQQIIGGARVIDGFQDRTLPHFPKGSRQQPSKGFVANSFFSGLVPSEFIFHAMSGREGLVDTAVKTAETGYMSRRLMKSLEDLSVQYDDTVRNSSSSVVQFQYGDDKLDPIDMEGNVLPVNFDRTFTQAVASTWNKSEQSLLPFEIKSLTHDSLTERRGKLQRKSLLGAVLPYAIDDSSPELVDMLESHRRFLDDLENFIAKKADDLGRVRENMELPSAKEGILDSDRQSKQEGMDSV